jgi:VacB/RNase II family 3'-5' exoribonuclease
MDKKRSTDHLRILRDIARRAMINRGFLPDFSDDVKRELAAVEHSPVPSVEGARDLRDLPWFSIDNDESRDLDQLTVADAVRKGVTKIRVAVADVDTRVRKGRAIDEHASHNTTAVYTPAQIFFMIPEVLSTDLTSLNDGEDRPAIVIEMIVERNGMVDGFDVYRALVRNRAKLAYNGVAAWLDGKGVAPKAMKADWRVADNLRIQDRVAARLRSRRQARGALSLETVQASPVFEEGLVRRYRIERKNRARELIEDFMIAANEVVARFLEAKQYPAIRRVVRTPKRWDRIVRVMADLGYRLPLEPDAKSLEKALVRERARNAGGFHDLSQTVIKLLGPGEYVAEMPGTEVPGHFGLAVKHYSHSTAPNRRYPDLITQRLVKAALNGDAVPYSPDQLTALALHCTLKEDDANKVERLVRKSAFALFLEPRIGDEFDAVVTGAAPKGTWVRIHHEPIEGRLVDGFAGLDIGDRLRVKLVHTDVERGFIDFRRVG